MAVFISLVCRRPVPPLGIGGGNFRSASAAIRLFLPVLLALLFAGRIATAEIARSFGLLDEPDTVFASNVVVDIIEHDGGVWFATSQGLNFSFDGGNTWLLYDESNGLVSSRLSALFSLAGRLWVATNTLPEGADKSISDGLSYTDDNGQNWTWVDFGPTDRNIPHLYGINRTIYDITGHHDEDFFVNRTVDWLFFTSFSAGLIASQDNGASWRRIYAGLADSINFYNVYEAVTTDTLLQRNRYFSCAVDTSHIDSLFLWAGTAGGLYQYVFVNSSKKPSSRLINGFSFCADCPQDSTRYYIGGDGGLTISTALGRPFESRFESDGLPGPEVTAVFDFGGRVFVGTVDTATGQYTGLAVSTDGGDSFVDVTSFPATDPLTRISDFAVIADRLYVAARESGLYVTADSGLTWQHILVDSSDTTPANRRNVVHALNALADTLRVGTDSGLVTLFLDPVGKIDSSRFTWFFESFNNSIRVVRVETEPFPDSTGTMFDSLIVWTINHPATASGEYGVGRFRSDLVTVPGLLRPGEVSTDIGILGDSVVIVGATGARYSTTDGSSWSRFAVSSGGDNMDADFLTVFENRADTILIGSDRGFGISTDRGNGFSIFRVNTDTLGADFVVRHTRITTAGGIGGNFIQALGVQHAVPSAIGEPARIWVSGNRSGLEPPEDSSISVSVVLAFDTAGNPVPYNSPGAATFERGWRLTELNTFAWNYEFNGESTFVATSNGLFCNCPVPGQPSDTGLTWDTLELVDSLGFPVVLEGTEVYAVEVVGPHLYVGTADRTLRFRLDNLDWVDTVFFVVDTADEVYAFPVPFSHSLNDAVDFHFVSDRDGPVTLKIYDFAMNLVTTVIDDEFFPAGVYPVAGQLRRTWDGRNDRGEAVAVGMYYFKVEFSGGDTEWGKIAVIP